MRTGSCKHGSTTLYRVNFFGQVGHVTIFSWMLTIACCFVVGLGLGLGLDFVSAWLVVMRTYLYYFPLSIRVNVALLLSCVTGDNVRKRIVIMSSDCCCGPAAMTILVVINIILLSCVILCNIFHTQVFLFHIYPYISVVRWIKVARIRRSRGVGARSTSPKDMASIAVGGLAGGRNIRDFAADSGRRRSGAEQSEDRSLKFPDERSAYRWRSAGGGGGGERRTGLR